MKYCTDKIVVLKLGSKCNLSCKHCHCMQSSYEYNPEIIEYIKNNGYTRVTFCGGEPTLYIDLIKHIVDSLPEDMQYKLVTNGTRLTEEMVTYFNTHNFTVAISYDGENDSRDRTFLLGWREFFNIKNRGMAVLYSESNKDIFKLKNDINKIYDKYLVLRPASLWLNFTHQTEVNKNEVFSNKELARDYCKFLGITLEQDFINLKSGNVNRCLALGMALKKWLFPIIGRGVRCCNEMITPLTVDGRFMLCPYGNIYVGDISTGVDWDKVESFLPERCKTCPIKSECGNTCIANVTDTECYISKVMNKHIKKLMLKYGITLDDLLLKFRGDDENGVQVCG